MLALFYFELHNDCHWRKNRKKLSLYFGNFYLILCNFW